MSVFFSFIFVAFGYDMMSNSNGTGYMGLKQSQRYLNSKQSVNSRQSVNSSFNTFLKAIREDLR